MRLRHPAVQRDDPGEHAKAHNAQQPDVIPQRMAVERREIQRAKALPHQPAGQRQQQRAEATEGKPQLAGGATARQEHAAQGHNFGHHHQRAKIAGDNGADRRRHEQVYQQTISSGVLVAVPVDIEQADKQPAQTERHQPDGIQRRNLNAVTNQRHHGLCGLPPSKTTPPAASVIRLPSAPPIPAIQPLRILWKEKSSASTAAAAKYATALLIMSIAFISPPR